MGQNYRRCTGKKPSLLPRHLFHRNKELIYKQFEHRCLTSNTSKVRDCGIQRHISFQLFSDRYHVEELYLNAWRPRTVADDKQDWTTGNDNSANPRMMLNSKIVDCVCY